MIGAFLHSLAFGTTLPFLSRHQGQRALSQKQLEMTADVMAHSLVYWVRDIHEAGLLDRGSRLYAMTSEGAILAVPTYGAVSAAKAALEAHTRQLALELAPEGITVNAIRAGVTDTPALRRIPGWERLSAVASERNPSGRMTRPEDVADALQVHERGLVFGHVAQVQGERQTAMRGDSIGFLVGQSLGQLIPQGGKKDGIR